MNWKSPRVVHCKKDGYDVYIGRPSKWGNPYEIGVDGTRDEVIEKFRRYAVKTGLDKQAKKELSGKVLGCWCSPKKCHGHLLADWSEK